MGKCLANLFLELASREFVDWGGFRLCSADEVLSTGDMSWTK